MEPARNISTVSGAVGQMLKSRRWRLTSGDLRSICGFSQDDNDEVGNAQFVIELGETLDVLGFYGRFDDLFDSKAGPPYARIYVESVR